MTGIVHSLISSVLMLGAGILMILRSRDPHLKWIVIYAFFLSITTILYLGIPSFQITSVYSIIRFTGYLIFLAAFSEILQTDFRKSPPWIVPAIFIIFVSAVFFSPTGFLYFVPRIIYPVMSSYIVIAFQRRHFLLTSLCIFSLLEAMGDVMLLVWKVTKLDVYGLQSSLVLWNSSLLVLLLIISAFYRNNPGIRKKTPEVKNRPNN